MSKVTYSRNQMRQMSVQDFADKALGNCEKAYKFVLLPESKFVPVTGKSEMVDLDVLERNQLQFGNGGSWIRENSSLHKLFFIVLKRKGKGEYGEILGIQLNGYRPQPREVQNSRQIDPQVRDYFKREDRCGRCAVRIKKSKKNIDHCNGRYNDPDFNPKDPMFFQVLCKKCNTWKRSQCKRCEQTGKRFDARYFPGEKIGWQVGGEKHAGTCLGCILDDFRTWRENLMNPEFQKKIIGIVASQGHFNEDDGGDVDSLPC